MAGFFGLFDYSKEGPGIHKDAPKKKRFFYFWELYFRKLSKLVILNLIYCIFLLPVLSVFFTNLWDNPVVAAALAILTLVTIGPATAAMTYLTRNMANEQPIFLWSDFWEKFKSNFKQASVFGILSTVITLILGFALLTYIRMLSQGILMYILLGLCLAATILYWFMNFYVYLLIVTVNLKLREILKNSFIFAVLGFKSNFFTLFFCGGLMFLYIWYFPVSLLVVLILGCSTISMIVSFNSYQYIQKYIIDPYNEQQKAIQDLSGEHGEDDEAIFSDAQILPNDDEDDEK